MSEKITRDGQEWVVKTSCRDCGHTWKGRYVAASINDIKPRPCPNCRKRRKEREGLREIIDSGRAPAYTGTSKQNIALDAAAEMVMQDYGLTDIKGATEIREGESQAPKIHPRLQAQADNMFGGKALSGTPLMPYTDLIKRGALSGAVSPANTGSPDPVTAFQAGERHRDLMARTTFLKPEGQK